MNHDDLGSSSERLPDLLALSAFVDDELPDSACAPVQAHLARDSEAARRVAAWRAQKSALKVLCSGPAREGPAVVVVHAPRPAWQRFARSVAWLVTGAGIALTIGSFIGPVTRGWNHNEPVSFARRADIAYAVYAPERRHPVEVAANEEAHLVAWLSTRLNRRLSVPSLQEYGYSLVGGRLLPGEAGPAAQFMYENRSGERLTLYVTGVARDETAFRLFRDGNRRTFYWVNDHMGYALSGPISEDKLRAIAIEVCGALGGRPESWE
ncbi:anti-sigma factor family protein [Trinickia acidisoli]|uniref:anti-sigma factor family protein n=1 Tax=Trinickia acidisoli TaxID=2767482 RepID=UPI001A8D2BF9|nr:anti-sigma factor [Trinickia acidisoli]